MTVERLEAVAVTATATATDANANGINQIREHTNFTFVRFVKVEYY